MAYIEKRIAKAKPALYIALAIIIWLIGFCFGGTTVRFLRGFASTVVGIQTQTDITQIVR